ncbi:unnamed protein product [Phytophthora fragariaefolia]|uniref:Unnamed protein product n=1 Tax=Phytophthora fragariaefolia TaxID=1490495 RepID=A0A9W6Y961_9STRA|nr:unnamed protein product [Phytophthora fragariaefolia]
MDAGVILENNSSTGHALLVAAKCTQCTFAANTANSASKYTTWAGVRCSNVTNDWPTWSPKRRQIQVTHRPSRPLYAEQFKLSWPPTLTGLDETGLPQSAEPVTEAKYIFTYAGEAGSLKMRRRVTGMEVTWMVLMVSSATRMERARL